MINFSTTNSDSVLVSGGRQLYLKHCDHLGISFTHVLFPQPIYEKMSACICEACKQESISNESEGKIVTEETYIFFY